MLHEFVTAYSKMIDRAICLSVIILQNIPKRFSARIGVPLHFSFSDLCRSDSEQPDFFNRTYFKK